MEICRDWRDYEILATGGGRKLERWGQVFLLRPDPQAIWKPAFDFETFPKLNALYRRSERGGGEWKILRPFPPEWTVRFEDLTFLIKPMGFKHTGLFPEQAVNWQRMRALIASAGRPVSVLNLFAYTGGATAACLKAGASVCHVDAAKGMVERAGQNVDLSGCDRSRARFIVDDCFKFVAREIRRGRRYDAVIMDPPSYGRGPNGETWKLEDGLYDLVALCRQVLSDRPLFFLLNSYTTGLQPAVLSDILNLCLKDFPGRTEAYEVCLPTDEPGVVLPCGATGIRYSGQTSFSADGGK